MSYMVRVHIEVDSILNVQLRLIHKSETDGHYYNLPTTLEVTVLVVGDFSLDHFEQNIIMEYHKRGLQRISEFHPSFTALNYPLLFPYGEDGHRVGLLHKDDVNRLHYKQNNLIMREYHAFCFQVKENERQTILLFERLL